MESVPGTQRGDGAVMPEYQRKKTAALWVVSWNLLVRNKASEDFDRIWLWIC